MACVIVNIGSNLGNRRLNLSRAMNRIARRFGPYDVSHVVESEPWGYDSPNRYANMAMMFFSDEEPQQVLAALQAIEREMGGPAHRNPDGSYADRLIDIDIMAIDDLAVNLPAGAPGLPALTLPHPHLAERRFFLEPMAELAPAWRHPSTGLTALQMLAALT